MPEPATPPIPESQIDPDAQKVIRRLTRNGYEAYLVGGCVRDLLLSRKPKDFDLATSATPSEVRELFRNCRIIGRRFRLAHVFFGPKIIETATFRANPREVPGEEGPESAEPEEGPQQEELLIRHDNVFGTAEEDARRRDFTINGLFYDLEEGRVIDYVDGCADLKRGSIRTIGDPDIRFREDPVRILRAIKFAARLGFEIEDGTYRAVITHREEIEKSAPPRVLEEIYRLLRGGAALESVILLRETGLLRILIPELNARLLREPTLLDPYLRAVDAQVARGAAPSNAVLLCLLGAQELRPLLDEREGERLRDPADLIDEVLAPLLARMRASRRDAERAKLLLLAQRRIWHLRRRSARSAGLHQRDWFLEAVLLHAIHRIAGGAPEKEVAAELDPHLRRGPGTAPSPSLPPHFGAPVPTVGEELDERGPRRRRGRRPRGPGIAAPTTAIATAAAPATIDRQPQSRAPDAPAGPPPDPEEHLENEEAALAAFNAVMNSDRFDE